MTMTDARRARHRPEHRRMGEDRVTTASSTSGRSWRWRLLGLAFLVLLFCQSFMVVDVLADIFYIDLYLPWFDHNTLELMAVVAMTVSLVVLGAILIDHMHQNRRYREVLRTASGQLLETLERKFDNWRLTGSEREIALLLIKGLTVNEIADIRGARPGTIKSQSNAVYRKAGIRNRSELAAYFIEDLLAGQSLLRDSRP